MNKLWILTLMFLAACGPGERQGDGAFVAGKWGHLQNLENIPASHLSLIHVQQDAPYKVCVPRYMDADFPGIREEIKAAINIWGHYIKRTIEVEFHSVDSSKPGRNIEQGDLLDRYYRDCPSGTDLVLGINDMGNTPALTSKSYSYSSSSFKRGLFLRRPSTDDLRGHHSWKTLQQLTGTTRTAQQILDMMIARDSVLYTNGSGELLTLHSITHEIGHVWGLCDQYALEGNTTNCDPDHASINEEGHIILHPGSVMSGTGWRNKIFLTDDDITGIRNLAARDYFKGNWPDEAEYTRDVAINEMVSQPIEHFELRGADYEDGRVIARFGLVTNVAVEIQIQLQTESGRWIRYGASQYSGPVEYHTVNFTLGYNTSEQIKAVKMKVTPLLRNEQDRPAHTMEQVLSREPAPGESDESN